MHEIGIGVGTGAAMLDAPCGVRTDGYAKPGRAVVDAPAAVDGRKHVGREAAIGIHVGREERHALGHQRGEAAGGVAQELSLPSGVPLSKTLRPERSIRLKCTCWPEPERSGIGLGHEGRLQALARGRRLHDLAQEDGVIGRRSRAFV